jgi:histidinol-phosphate aminotransferase
MVSLSYGPDLAFDTGRILDELQQSPTRMLVLANPNQPTGTLIDEVALAEIIAAARRRDVLVVMDEAYHLFTPRTALGQVRDNDNLIVVRTFSKAFGLAGLRIGYCVADPARIRELMLLRPVTDANSLALKCAEYVLDHMDWMGARIEDFVAGREYLFREMTAAGVATYPSHTNFVLIRCGSMEQGGAALAEIRRRGYLLKGPFGFRPLENCIRVSIGPLDLMRRFWADCAEVLKAYSAA